MSLSYISLKLNYEWAKNKEKKKDQISELKISSEFFPDFSNFQIITWTRWTVACCSKFKYLKWLTKDMSKLCRKLMSLHGKRKLFFDIGFALLSQQNFENRERDAVHKNLVTERIKTFFSASSLFLAFSDWLWPGFLLCLLCSFAVN